MMAGFIKQKYGVLIGQNRIGKALSRVAPHYHERRKSNTAKMTNPIPYRANYFGHKLHLDQNEKLQMYGVTHIAAIDGHSQFVVAGAVMSRKNNIKISRCLQVLLISIHLMKRLKEIFSSKEMFSLWSL